MIRYRVLGGVAAALFATAAWAQGSPAFPPQNPLGPIGAAQQENYPYPGQCNADPASAASWTVDNGNCDVTKAPSFACESPTSGLSNFTAGTWRACGAPVPFNVLSPLVADPATTPRFVWEVLNPPDYHPDTTSFPGADYYEIGVHEAWGFQILAGAGLFPNPGLGTCATATGTEACDVNGALPAACVAQASTCTPTLPGGVQAVPNGMQWTGIVCNVPGGCTCPAELEANFAASYCPGGTIPQGAPLFTPIWGVGQKNNVGGPLAGVLNMAPSNQTGWSNNEYVATWPSISIRGTRGRPVIVRWVNEFPNNHVFCPHPEAADWPCAIDRTFMGVKAKMDPGAAPRNGVFSAEVVNRFGSAQQPDNSWVTHLHGGEIPPSTDGFAEKWFGNRVSGEFFGSQNAASTYEPWYISPHFDGPHISPLFRPGGDPAAAVKPVQSWMNDTYTYPMNNEEALIWFHDHTLGKTHHNVVAGPAGFFPVYDPAKHGAVSGGVCQAANCDYTWTDPVTLPRDGLTIPKYDLFLAIQDRAFNDDGSINFMNGMGQTPDPLLAPLGTSFVTNGVNPQVHPVWVPEYFGDHAMVNGVAWPKRTVEAGWHRVRVVNGSDSRCWTVGFSTLLPAPGARPRNNVPFTMIANDQGYLQLPKQGLRSFTMCPGERYEMLVNFGSVPGINPAAGGFVYMTNSANAPYPDGDPIGVYPLLNTIMRFDVQPSSVGTPVPTCASAADFTYDPANPGAAGTNACIHIPTAVDPNFVDLRALATAGAGGGPRMCATNPAPCISAIRHMYLNERVDAVTDAPLGMQINGVPFEYKVTETPREGTIELWKIINLTVDAHPMHPHLVKHQRVSIRPLNVGLFKQALCGSPTCQPGTSPGLEMQVVPDVDSPDPLTLQSFYTGPAIPQSPTGYDSGNKDASVALPGYVTSIIAEWKATWPQAASAAAATAPGGGAGVTDLDTCIGSAGAATGCSHTAVAWSFEPVTTGPYVWHCHINSHEDSEMMRTSLVIPATP